MEEQFFVLFQRYKRVVEKEAHKVSHEKGDVHDIVMDIMLYAHKKIYGRKVSNGWSV